jgi:hypothetical protein
MFDVEEKGWIELIASSFIHGKLTTFKDHHSLCGTVSSVCLL